jgi:malonate transporter and related proteins
MINLIFTIHVVAPIFILIFLGVILKKINLIDDNFSQKSSALVYKFAIPALVFIKLANVDMQNIINKNQILFCYIGIISFFILLWIGASLFIKDKKNRGIFIQGSFRSNYAIIGLPLVLNIFGDQGLANAAILLAAILPLHNILAILALTMHNHSENKISIKKFFILILTNPLILAPFCALPFTLFKIPIAPTINITFTYLAGLTIPLSLIAIGGSLRINSLKKGLKTAIGATIIKSIILPLTFTILAIKLGFRGISLSSIYFYAAAPTAINSYVMAKEHNCNSELASLIIVTSTIASLITISIGVFALTSLGYF